MPTLDDLLSPNPDRLRQFAEDLAREGDTESAESVRRAATDLDEERRATQEESSREQGEA